MEEVSNVFKFRATRLIAPARSSTRDVIAANVLAKSIGKDEGMATRRVEAGVRRTWRYRREREIVSIETVNVSIASDLSEVVAMAFLH